MSREIEVHNHHLNGSLPADIPEDLREFLSEEIEGVSFEEAILQQASVYQSYQESGRDRVVATDDDHISDSSCSSEDEDEDEEEEEDRNENENEDEDEDEDEDDGDSSRHETVNSQEGIDEALARSLQEGEEYDEFFIPEFSGRASGITESPSTEVASSDSSEDDIDPDNMRYEDLVNLGETVGVEHVGLSADRLSQLPNSIYTSGMFSQNKEENCAICQDNFKFGKRVITLPCSHLYHSKCITVWLKLKRSCPICQKEVE